MTNETGHFVEWLIWRINEVVAKRQDMDYQTMSHGGAGFDAGYRLGQEEALRDALDMFESTFGEPGDD
jgi:hypothetical protein